MENEFWTTDEVVEFLGVSRITLQNWIKAGKITVYKTGVGNRNLYKKTDVRALLVPHPIEHPADKAA